MRAPGADGHQSSDRGRRQVDRGGCGWAAFPVFTTRLFELQASLTSHTHKPIPPTPLTPPPQVEFPTLSLASSQGDGEGQNEMNASMDYLRKTLVGFQDQAATTRVFFPDQQELVGGGADGGTWLLQWLLGGSRLELGEAVFLVPMPISCHLTQPLQTPTGRRAVGPDHGPLGRPRGAGPKV